MARRGGGGGTASATAAVGSNVPRASRSSAAAFFARMDVRRRRWRGRRCYRAGGYESRCWTARLEGGGGQSEASSSLRRTTTMDGIFPRRRRNGDGCGDAAVPSDQRRRQLRQGRSVRRRQPVKARRCGARGIVEMREVWWYMSCWEVSDHVEEVKKPVPLFI